MFTLKLKILAAMLSVGLAGFGGWKIRDWQANTESLKKLEASQKATKRMEEVAETNFFLWQKETDKAVKREREFYAKLSEVQNVPCLDRGTVERLNAIRVRDEPSPTGTAQNPHTSAEAPGGIAGDSAREWVGAKDVAENLGICRAEYGKIARQLNELIDFLGEMK